MCQHRRVHRVVVAVGLLLVLWATRLPATPAEGQASADWQGLRVLLETLATRFGPTERERAFEAVRPKLARAALIPSPLFDDASAWMTRGDTWRALDLTGYTSGGLYRLGMRAEAAAPALPGQYRGRMRLQRLAGGRFEWTASDALAIGEASPSDLGHASAAFLAWMQHANGDAAAARAALAKALPRATAQFGHLFRLEAVTLQPDADGSTAVRLSVRLTPAGLRGLAPRYATFVEQYVAPVRLSMIVADAGGVPWLGLEAADLLWTLRLRVRDGHLVPRQGPTDRRLPVRLRATADVATRLGRFGVGARRLIADLALTRTAGDVGLRATFVDEPDWQMPFLVETVLNSPLRYPFEAPGSEVAWSLRDVPGTNLLERRYRARVSESWILRWLSGMANDAVGSFRDGAEREADRYHRACLLALRDDLAALDTAR